MQFVLRYKLNGGPKEINFDAATEIEAKSIANEWCNLQDFKFVAIRPFYLDMKKDLEERKAKGAKPAPSAAKLPKL